MTEARMRPHELRQEIERIRLKFKDVFYPNPYKPLKGYLWPQLEIIYRTCRNAEIAYECSVRPVMEKNPGKSLPELARQYREQGLPVPQDLQTAVETCSIVATSIKNCAYDVERQWAEYRY